MKTIKKSSIVKVLYIRGVVCTRCIKVLHDELMRIGVTIKNAKLGRAEVEYNPRETDVLNIQAVLEKNGFEIIIEHEQQLVDQIKTFILDAISKSKDEGLPKRFSEKIANELGFNYSHLTRMFTRHERITIEKYIILHKVEKVMELLDYNDQLNLDEIVYQLNYSSASHLSKQFKTVTGISLRDYRSFLKYLRKPVDYLRMK